MENQSWNRKWRTLIHVERVERDQVLVIIPAFSPRVVINLALDSLPENVVSHITSKAPNAQYLHAKVNIGAYAVSSLKFDEWEIG